MPNRLVTAHFRPLNQLLQWLQCLSSEETLGGLIDTLQNLQSLNPMQLLRAARDYRYEVDESRLGEECAQYLNVMQKDWENQRARNVQVAEDEAQTESSESSASPEPEVAAAEVARSNMEKHIDDVFSSPSTFLDYEPPVPPETLGELLDSRYMVSFESSLFVTGGASWSDCVWGNSSPLRFLRRPIGCCASAPRMSLVPFLVAIAVTPRLLAMPTAPRGGHRL
jgi:hypothetical protein